VKLTLVPLLGPFHLHYPAYNAVSVRETVAAFQPDALALTPLGPDGLSTPAWQSTPEIPLPLSVVPWARGRVPLHGVFERSPDKGAEGDFRRYLEGYPQLRGTLQELDARLRPLHALLQEPLTLARVQREVVPTLRAHQEAREAAFEDGPGTDWLRARVGVMAGRVLELPYARVAVLASADHLPFLEDALCEHAELEAPPQPAPTDAARERSLLDFAFRGEVSEPGNVIAQLRTLEVPEARFHEANLLLAGGHVAEALDLLEATSRADFSSPYFLPGYLLARLGQLRDLVGDREGAKRAYRGTLALSWAPEEAVEAARRGLDHPFEGAD